MRKHHVVTQILIVAVAYFIAARLGLLLATGGHVTPVWSPSGIALAAVLMFGRRSLWGVALGSFLADILDFYNGSLSTFAALSLSSAFAVGTALTALLGAMLSKRFITARNPLARVRDVYVLLGLGGIVSCMINASVGVTSLCISGMLAWTAYGTTWLSWWLSDSAGVLVVTPLLLAWLSFAADTPFKGRWLEVTLCYTLLSTIVAIAFVLNDSNWFGHKPLAFLPIPFLVWPTIRFGQRGATAAIVLVTLAAVWATIHNVGPFHGDSFNTSLLLLELFLGVVVLTALSIGAIVNERHMAQQLALGMLESRVRERTTELQIVNSKLLQENSVRTAAEKTAQKLLIEADRTRSALLSLLEDQKQTEEALRESESTFSSAFEHTAVGTGLVALDGRWLRVNSALCAFLGYGAEELLTIGLNVNTHPHDAAAGLDQMQQLVAGDITQYTREKRFICRDGRVVWGLQCTSLIRNSAGVPRFGVVQIVDINERKNIEVQQYEADMRFRQLAEHIEEVFWVIDPHKYQVLYVSPAYEAIWGRTCQSLYDYPPSWQEAICLEDRERIRIASTKMVSGNYDVEYRITRPDGTQRWIRDKAFPIRDSGGEVTRLVGVAEDITSHLHLEAQLRQAQKMEAIGTLAGGIAHDFNNILAAIKGYTQLAQAETNDQSQVQEYLATVLQGARRATELVKQITTFSRQNETQHSPVTLQQVVREALILLRATIPTNVDIQVSVDDRAPSIMADATQIHQVVMNLCTNAWHAMQSKPGNLDLKVEQVMVDDELAKTNTQLHVGPYVRLTVADTGCGMDVSTAARIFEPFFTTKAAGEGSGLGLAVVHGIVLSHHGAISVRSVVGVGTVFHLYFPQYQGGQLGVPLALSSHRALQGQGERVLLVDDEAPLVHLISIMLEKLGYVVEAHAYPNDAVAAFGAAPNAFDLVISDLSMPTMSGLELTVELRRFRQDIPIMVISGYVDSSTRERIALLGIERLLAKPFTLEALGVAVQQILIKR